MEKIFKTFRFLGNETNIILNLKNNFHNIGYYTNSGYIDENADTTVISNMVTGISISRLNELKKYTESSIITDKYKISINGSNGIILPETTDDLIVYYIDEIKFFDNLNDGSTYFEFNTPTDHGDLENDLIIKDDRFLNFVDTKIENQIDIVRQSLNIFESHIRLSDIRNVEELTLYGGRYYNIYNNS